MKAKHPAEHIAPVDRVNYAAKLRGAEERITELERQLRFAKGLIQSAIDGEGREYLSGGLAELTSGERNGNV